MPDVRMTLSRVVELDRYTFQLSVIERWTERRWFRNVEREQQKHFTLDVRAGRWLDGDHFVTDTARSLRLYELLLASRSETGALDAFVGIDAPVHVLPPVPVMPQRLRRELPR